MTKTGYNRIFFYFILITPIVADLANSFLIHLAMSPGMIIRGVIVILGLFAAFQVNIRYCAVFLLLLLSIVFSLLHNSLTSIYINKMLEIQQIFKLIYILSYASLIYRCIKRDHGLYVKVPAVIVYLGCIESLGILIPILFGYHVSTYAERSFGTRGILLNPNDIALSLVMSYTFASWLFVTSNKLIFKICFFAIGAALLFVGTRTSVVGTFLIPFLIFISFAGFKGKIKKSTLNYVYLLFIVVAFAVAFPKVLNFIMLDSYLLNKFIKLGDSLNVRGDLFTVGLFVLYHGNLLDIIFGQGTTEFYFQIQNLGHFFSFHDWGKRVEVDWVDIVGCYGVVVAVISYGYYISILKTSIFLTRKSILEHGIPISLSLFIFLFHSFWAGHAIMSPLPGTYFGILLAVVIYADMTHYQET